MSTSVCVTDRSTEVSIYAVTKTAEASKPSEFVESLSLHFDIGYPQSDMKIEVFGETFPLRVLPLGKDDNNIFIAACSVHL